MASEDTPEARGRLQQDSAFSMGELVGRSLRRLMAARLEGGEPLCLYVEVDTPGCHRMFLDAGLAVWEDWGGITQDDRELVLDDLLTAWCLDGAVVRSAEALAGPGDGAARQGQALPGARRRWVALAPRLPRSRGHGFDWQYRPTDPP